MRPRRQGFRCRHLSPTIAPCSPEPEKNTGTVGLLSTAHMPSAVDARGAECRCFPFDTFFYEVYIHALVCIHRQAATACLPASTMTETLSTGATAARVHHSSVLAWPESCWVSVAPPRLRVPGRRSGGRHSRGFSAEQVPDRRRSQRPRPQRIRRWATTQIRPVVESRGWVLAAQSGEEGPYEVMSGKCGLRMVRTDAVLDIGVPRAPRD